MPNVTYSVEFGEGVLQRLESFSRHSAAARLQVGMLLQKAEIFDGAGISKCQAQSEIRCIGQHEVLPVKNGRLYAFVELKKNRTQGCVFLVDEYFGFGDLRRVWQRVYHHFGYDYPELVRRDCRWL